MKRSQHILCFCLITLLACGCSRPTQVVQDQECFKAVDALWTAVKSQRADLLQQSSQELQLLQQAGKLSRDGHDELAEIIQKANSGEWKNAAQELKRFMEGQRRS